MFFFLWSLPFCWVFLKKLQCFSSFYRRYLSDLFSRYKSCLVFSWSNALSSLAISFITSKDVFLASILSLDWPYFFFSSSTLVEIESIVPTYAFASRKVCDIFFVSTFSSIFSEKFSETKVQGKDAWFFFMISRIL